MMKPETKFWQTMRGGFTSLETWRVENLHQPGMPDVHFLTKEGVAGWMELKTVKRPKNKVAVTYDQLRWARKYNETGGLSLLVVKVGAEDIYIYSHPDKIEKIYDGLYCHEVKPEAHIISFGPADKTGELEKAILAICEDWREEKITEWHY